MLDYRQEIENIFALRASEPPISIAQYMDTLKEQKIVLYGAGAFGCENLRLFQKYGVYPVAFLDRKAKPSEEKMGLRTCGHIHVAARPSAGQHQGRHHGPDTQIGPYNT